MSVNILLCGEDDEQIEVESTEKGELFVKIKERGCAIIDRTRWRPGQVSARRACQNMTIYEREKKHRAVQSSHSKYPCIHPLLLLMCIPYISINEEALKSALFCEVRDQHFDTFDKSF